MVQVFEFQTVLQSFFDKELNVQFLIRFLMMFCQLNFISLLD